MIQTKNLLKKYKQDNRYFSVLNNVSFHIPQGRLTMFIGPSGAGKTSLLKCLATLHHFDEGECLLEGKAIDHLSSSQRASEIGFVLQQFHLFPHMDVLGNCMHPLLHVLGMSKSAALEQAQNSLELLNMGAYASSYPQKLSGGQQQRAAIARALSLQPKLLMFDEPTSALDPESKKCFEAILKDLLNKGITLAISSHDMPFVRKNLDRIYFIEEGAIVEHFDKEIHSIEDMPKITNFLKTEY